LRDASVDDVASINDDTVRRRARHVITENARVRDFVDAITSHRYDDAGALMSASHASLRDDFDVSTPDVDALVERTLGKAGVYGARMTGGGFGGFVVALCAADAPIDGAIRFVPSAGATVVRD
jgi:galactokinase